MPMFAVYLVCTTAVNNTGRFFNDDFIVFGIETVQMSSSSYMSFNCFACLIFASFTPSLTLPLPGESLLIFVLLNLGDVQSHPGSFRICVP
jgi:hypothetical protein